MNYKNPSHPFISGDAFESICRNKLDERHWNSYPAYDIQDKVYMKNNFWFVKTDYLRYFFELHIPNEPFYLFTGNSDINITEIYKNLIDYPYMIKWFAQNVMYEHDKLISIPIGIPNPMWTIGKPETLLNAQLFCKTRQNIFNASYDVNTNPVERHKCQHFTGIKSKFKRFEENRTIEDHFNYLIDIGRSLFILCPNGNGIDTHRIWEALYMGSIPIVTDSINIRFYKDFPILILEKWEDFKDLEINESNAQQKFNEIWSNRKCHLPFDDFLNYLFKKYDVENPFDNKEGIKIAEIKEVEDGNS